MPQTRTNIVKAPRIACHKRYSPLGKIKGKDKIIETARIGQNQMVEKVFRSEILGFMIFFRFFTILTDFSSSLKLNRLASDLENSNEI